MSSIPQRPCLGKLKPTVVFFEKRWNQGPTAQDTKMFGKQTVASVGFLPPPSPPLLFLSLTEGHRGFF